MLALALFAAGVLDLFDGDPVIGAVEVVVAAAVGFFVGRSFARRFRPIDLTLLEALSAAAVFAVFGLLGLSATLSGDSVRTAFGALAAVILLPAAAFLVLVGVRTRRGTRQAEA